MSQAHLDLIDLCLLALPPKPKLSTSTTSLNEAKTVNDGGALRPDRTPAAATYSTASEPTTSVCRDKTGKTNSGDRAMARSR